MQDNEGQKNLVMAIALSLAVLLGWQYFFVWPKEQERRALEQSRQQSKPNVPAGTPASPPATGAPGATALGTAPAAIGTTKTGAGGEQPDGNLLSREAALATSPRLKIDTARLAGSHRTQGWSHR